MNAAGEIKYLQYLREDYPEWDIWFDDRTATWCAHQRQSVWPTITDRDIEGLGWQLYLIDDDPI